MEEGCGGRNGEGGPQAVLVRVVQNADDLSQNGYGGNGIIYNFDELMSGSFTKGEHPEKCSFPMQKSEVLVCEHRAGICLRGANAFAV
jgi:hypothetical protein